ncbi:cytochrome p450 90b1 [Quercus suber]|uniref:Cytochrome p450 90b1 n=1 Tax=Quercus suber TaxID=58331 RepID=A0AAW0JIA7_QUESU
MVDVSPQAEVPSPTPPSQPSPFTPPMHPETPLYPHQLQCSHFTMDPPSIEPMTMIPTLGLYIEHHDLPTSSLSDPLGPPHDDEPKADAPQPPPPPKHCTRVKKHKIVNIEKEVVNRYIDEGVAELVPGVLFIDVRHATLVTRSVDTERGDLSPQEKKTVDAIVKASEYPLSIVLVVSIVLDILLGGYETTATLMSLIVYFLGQAPNALENLKEEHQGIRKRKEDGEPLNWEDYKKMKFTRNVIINIIFIYSDLFSTRKVICEAMRCGNVVKFLHRKALQDVKYKASNLMEIMIKNVADILIPSGWKVFPIFTAVNFDSALHRNPLEFNP